MNRIDEKIDKYLNKNKVRKNYEESGVINKIKNIINKYSYKFKPNEKSKAAIKTINNELSKVKIFYKLDNSEWKSFINFLIKDLEAFYDDDINTNSENFQSLAVISYIDFIKTL